MEKKIKCNVHCCSHCDCDNDCCELDQIKICNCDCDEATDKEETMCNSFKEKD